MIDPSFRTFGAFSEIEQIALRKAVGRFPFVVIVFVRAGDIDGIEPVIIPDRGRDASDFDFMCWLAHVFLHFVKLIRLERKAIKPCAPFESLPAPKSRMVLPTPYGQNSIVRKCVGGGASSTIP